MEVKKPKSRMHIDEAWVKKQVNKILKEFKVQRFMPSAGPFGRAGAHDFICCAFGRYLSIETKANGNKPSPMQIDFGKQVQKAGGIAIRIDEKNYELLRTLLQRMQDKTLPESYRGSNWDKYVSKKQRSSDGCKRPSANSGSTAAGPAT